MQLVARGNKGLCLHHGTNKRNHAQQPLSEQDRIRFEYKIKEGQFDKSAYSAEVIYSGSESGTRRHGKWGQERGEASEERQESWNILGNIFTKTEMIIGTVERWTKTILVSLESEGIAFYKAFNLIFTWERGELKLFWVDNENNCENFSFLDTSWVNFVY